MEGISMGWRAAKRFSEVRRTKEKAEQRGHMKALDFLFIHFSLIKQRKVENNCFYRDSGKQFLF
jgi:hypothetical protein